MNDARYPNISAIDNRLAELENEKQRLLALREALRSAQNERSVQTFTPEQKVALFRQRFRGREDIFANRWQNQQGRSGYSVAFYRDWETDRKSTRLNSSHITRSRMPSSA